MAPYTTAVTVGALTAAGGYILFKTMAPSRVAFGFPPYRLTPVELVEANGLTHDVNHYKFKLPSSESPAAPVGSAMLIKTPAGIRPFTPLYNNTDPGYLHFAIKNYNRGVSKSLTELKLGDKVQIAGPIPYVEVVNPGARYDYVYLIGAGNGITPLWSYLTDALNDPISRTKLKLIYANKAEEDIVFMDEIEKLKHEYPGRFEIVHILEKTSEVAKYTGRLTGEILKKEIDAVDSNSQILVCGPPKFVETVAGPKPTGPPFAQGTFGGSLKDIGCKQSQVVKY